MADLRTTFVGLKLKNPIIVSSSGLTENLEKMRRCQENGAAAVILKSYFEEEVCRTDPTPRYRIIEHDMDADHTFTFMSYEQASDWDIDRYAEEVERAVSELDIKIIPSINCITEEGWVEAARKVEKAGAHAIELNTSCPHGSITFRGGAVENVITDTVKTVREAVDVPLIAKISPMLTSPGAVAKKLAEAGAQGVTIFNRMTGLEIDVEKEEPALHGGYAGHGGPWAIQYPLRWISELSPDLGIDIAGSGGVSQPEDVFKYLLAGATAVQVCSYIVLNGYHVIGELLCGFEGLLDKKGYVTLDGLRGKVATKIIGTDEVDRRQTVVARVQPEPVAPCVAACPARVPAQSYVHRIARGDYEGALRAIRSANPFQSVCAWACYHPCETECVRAMREDPIAIRALKRFAVEWGHENSPLDQEPIEKEERTGQRIAIVGSGPSGLTAAHDLAKMGHEVTVIEAGDSPGGMLRFAIPSHRLPQHIVDQEISYIERHGVDIRCNRRLGKDLELPELERNHDAVLLAIGAHRSAWPGIPGEGAEGVMGAMKFLARSRHEKDLCKDERVVIVGGGNTAFDAARCALRCGASDVYVAYRRGRGQMPATEEEVSQAEEEGVKVLHLATPVRVVSEEGKVTGLTLKGGHLGEPGVDGRRKPILVEDIEYTLGADRVLMAISQVPATDPLESIKDLELGLDGEITTVDEFGRTSREGLFAAGDVTGGGGSIIEAIGFGRRVAIGIDCYLNGKGVREARSRWGVVEPVDKHNVIRRTIDRRPAERLKIPARAPARRIKDSDPVELPLGESAARKEGDRCLRCGCGIGCEVCYNVCPYDAVELTESLALIDEEKCTGCGLCVERCPNDKIDLVPLEEPR